MTPPSTWTVLSVAAGPAAADALEERLRAAFGLEPARLERPGDDTVWLEFYFADDAAARLAARAVGARRDVRHAVLRACRPRHWQTFWRRRVRPLRVGRRLLVIPDWARVPRDARGRAVVRVRPGLGFGTGDHFTTAFCLEALAERIDRARAPSCCDVGAGTGILAVAAAKLGARRVLAVDNDPHALAAAEDNVRINRVGARVRVRAGDVLAGGLPSRFDIVCANLYGELLRRAAPALSRAARRTLILSGLREDEADGVAEAFLAQGARERVRDGDDAWCGLVLDAPARGPCARPRPSVRESP